MPYEVEETPKIPKLESVDITDFSEFCNQLSQLLRKETATHMSKRTEAQVLEDVTQEYIESLDITNLPSLYDMIGELMARTIDEYELENSVKAKGQKWPIPRDLQNIQIALMISAIYPICCIACAGYEADPAYGVKMPRVGTETMVNLLVPLPPLAEQERIIAKIEELLPLVDRYEQAWSRLEAFNRRFPLDMQKSLLQWAIQGKLVEQRPDEGTAEELYQQIQTEKQRLAKGGKIKKEKPLPEIAEDEVPFEIPESWKWMRLRDIVEALGDGIHGTPEFDSLGRYFFINGNNLEKGKIIVRDDTKRVSYAEFEKHILDRRMCPSGHRIVETVRRIIHNERRHSKKVLCILYIFRRRRKESSWLYL